MTTTLSGALSDTPTFQQQYQKIVSAYYKNELNPMDGCACFIGNLLNNNGIWENIRCGITFIEREIDSISYSSASNFINEKSGGLYTPLDIITMEANFLRVCYKFKDTEDLSTIGFVINRKTEESLFLAMQSTLEMLRKIHEAKGEIIYGYDFKQRELCEK